MINYIEYNGNIYELKYNKITGYFEVNIPTSKVRWNL